MQRDSFSSSVYAIWGKQGLLPRRYKKHEKKKDLREVQSRYRPFEKMQIDVKELRDIPNILDQSLALGLQKKKELPNRYGLPMYQYTAAIFADRVLIHLANHGISPRIIQTDNGTEFVNTSDATDDTPLFIQVVTRDNKTKHRRIPPGAKTWQSDVETSHWIIEREFYDVVNVRSDQNFIAKLRVYQWGFNVMRKNSYRGNRTPYEIIKEEEDMKYATLPKTILDFPTCILDEKFYAFIRGGYHVSLPTNKRSAVFAIMPQNCITQRRHVGINIIAQNKKARHDYEILEKFEAGIVLSGAEVKALRAKRANLSDAFCRFIKGELYLMNAHIALLETANKYFTPDTRAPRKLLLHKKQLEKLYVKVHKDGLTIVPIMIYFNERNYTKVSIAIAKGKKLHDKRADMKAKTLDREAKSAMKNCSY